MNRAGHRDHRHSWKTAMAKVRAAGLSVLMLGVVFATTSPARAHHSFAEFDAAKTEELSGTVIWVSWANPHNYLRMKAADGSVWLMEFGTPGTSVRMGWTANTIQVGQNIHVTYAPARSEASAGALRSVTLPDGRTLRTPISYVYGEQPKPGASIGPAGTGGSNK